MLPSLFPPAMGTEHPCASPERTYKGSSVQVTKVPVPERNMHEESQDYLFQYIKESGQNKTLQLVLDKQF